jgi:hypothetical protein
MNYMLDHLRSGYGLMGENCPRTILGRGDCRGDRRLRKPNYLSLSADSLRSQSVCKKERARALKYKKPIGPLLLDRGAEMPFRLEGRQYIDFTGDLNSENREAASPPAMVGFSRRRTP